VTNAAPMQNWEGRAAVSQRDMEAGKSGSGGEWRREQKKNLDGKKRTNNNNRQKDFIQVSELSWAAQLKKRREERTLLDPLTAEDEEFVREMRMTLNKLTVERFDALSDKIIQQIAGSTRPNRGVPTLMQLVFEKATTEHHFINMYVDLCVKLHSWFTQSERPTTMELQSDFRRILLNQCQTSFEAYLEPPEGFEGLRGNELYEAQVKYKTKMLGNIRLVGQLVRHGMLAPKIALAVALELARETPLCEKSGLRHWQSFWKRWARRLMTPIGQSTQSLLPFSARSSGWWLTPQSVVVFVACCRTYWTCEEVVGKRASCVT